MKCTLLHPSHKMPTETGIADYRTEVSMFSAVSRFTMRRPSAIRALASSSFGRPDLAGVSCAVCATRDLSQLFRSKAV